MLKMPWTKHMEYAGNVFTMEPMSHVHIEQILRIENEAFADPWSALAFSHVIQGREHSAIVAIQNREIAGYCVTLLDECSIQIANLAVSVRHRRLGIARNLMTQQQVMLRRKQNQILAAVSDKNLSAQLFFKSLFFNAVSIGSRFFANGDDAYILQWRVGNRRDYFPELKHADFVLPGSHDRGVPVAR